MEVLEYYDDEKIRKEARFLSDSGNKNLSGISLVNRIDELARKKGITRKSLCEGYFDDNDDTLEICKNCIKCISGYYQNNEIPYEIKKE